VIRDLDGALALLRAERLLPMERLVAEIAGRVTGSWWGHPEGKRIYRVANELEDHEDVLVVKLVDAKVTFVHRALWSALLRVVTDHGWRAEAAKALAAPARALLDEVERAGRLPLARKSAASDALTRSLLVLSAQEHTDAGHHVTVLRSWRSWAKKAKAKAGTMTLAEALSAVPAPSSSRPARSRSRPRRGAASPGDSRRRR
jgi:hypothetical protein